MYTPIDTLKADEEIKELFRRDPETAALHTIDSYKKKQEASEYEEKYHSNFLEVNQMLHVLCLTPICDNDAMRALYSDKCKGIAIGYKVEKKKLIFLLVLARKEKSTVRENF